MGRKILFGGIKAFCILIVMVRIELYICRIFLNLIPEKGEYCQKFLKFYTKKGEFH